MENEDYGVLESIRDIMATSRSFHQTVRYLDGTTRNQLVALHERNISLALNVVRAWAGDDNAPTLVMNIPLNSLEDVPIVPTPTQISTATELRTLILPTQCVICQEEMPTGTNAKRILHCGHLFHRPCIESWFQLNPRCPVCRYDIRDFQPPASINSNAHMLHPNGQS